jgi:microcystin-dependent protein
MGNPYVGEIRLFAGNFAPAGWNFCNGAVLPISEFETLFNLIGTTYGGDGQQTFQLPDLRGRVPVHQGTGSGLSNYVIGQVGGRETVTLTINQMPSHRHAVASTAAATRDTPAGNVLGSPGATGQVYTAATGGSGALASAANAAAGGSQPHENMMPTLCVNFIISLFGIFPSQN